MTLHIAQITDCHLQENPNTPYKGIDADAHVDQCLMWLRNYGPVDVLILTGDLSNFGSQAAYIRLKNKLKKLPCPCIWLPGNHDNAATMAQVSGQEVGQLRVLDYEHWRLLMLNTTELADGCGGGSMSSAQMEELKQVLKSDSKTPTCVFMHHNAVPVNSLWQDNIMLGNSKQFNAVIAAYANVKAVVCGHVHQEFDKLIGGARFLATPSSAVQFACEQKEDKVQEELGPGLRLFSLLDNGQISTNVQRLPKHKTSQL